MLFPPGNLWLTFSQNIFECPPKCWYLGTTARVEMTFAWASLLASITLIGPSMSWTTLVSELKERKISKNTSLATIRVLGKEWRVTFEVIRSINYKNHLFSGETSRLHKGSVPECFAPHKRRRLSGKWGQDSGCLDPPRKRSLLLVLSEWKK